MDTLCLAWCYSSRCFSLTSKMTSSTVLSLEFTPKTLWTCFFMANKIDFCLDCMVLTIKGVHLLTNQIHINIAVGYKLAQKLICSSRFILLYLLSDSCTKPKPNQDLPQTAALVDISIVQQFY